MPIDSFTGKQIPKGRALMYVKRDGTIYWFGSKKSEKNLLKLRRNPSETKWTDFYHKEKEIKAKSKEAAMKKEKGKGVRSQPHPKGGAPHPTAGTVEVK